MNCPHCGKSIDLIQRVSSTESVRPVNAEALPWWMSAEAWSGYQEINGY